MNLLVGLAQLPVLLLGVTTASMNYEVKDDKRGDKDEQSHKGDEAHYGPRRQHSHIFVYPWLPIHRVTVAAHPHTTSSGLTERYWPCGSVLELEINILSTPPFPLSAFTS